MSVSGDGADPAFADAHKKGAAGVEGSASAGTAAAGHSAGGVLHQRRSLPYCPARMAGMGFLFVATVGYFTLYSKSKPGTTAGDVAMVAVGSGGKSK